MLQQQQNEAEILNQAYVSYKLDENQRTETELYICLESYVRKVAFILTNSPEEVFIKETAGDILMGLDKFKGSSKLSTWIWKVVKNACIDAARKESLNREILFSDLNQSTLWSIIDETPDLETYEHVDSLRMLGNFLTPTERTVLEMKLHGHDRDEIAIKIEKTPKTVTEMWQLIKKRLKDIYMVNISSEGSIESVE